MPEDDVMERPDSAFAPQQQAPPGATAQMSPKPDHAEHRYQGCFRLRDKVALIAGGDSGIGRAVAIAPAYVLLASDEASYINGALSPVIGGRPIL